MITYLKDRSHYEDRYDKMTVDIGRRETDTFLKARSQFYEKAQITKQDEANVMEFWWERIYWWLVELPYLLPRWEERDTTIASWMADDRASDKRLASARPRSEPVCTHCGRQGLRLTTKELLHRDNSSEQSVLFMFDCNSCKKRSAYCEDGREWVSPVTPCPKCTTSLIMDVKVKGRTMTTIHKCAACDYNDVERIKLGERVKPDPDYERDKKLFCLSEERGRTMQAYRPKWEDAMRMMDDDMRRASNKELYEAAAKIEQLKIPQLIERLRTAIEKSDYIEVTFDKPELGGYVTIEFSCMDSEASRDDSKSRKALKKIVTTTLASTNWRLMSDGVSYRLGYLSGKLRAYEDEQDLVKLVSEQLTRSRT